LGIESSLLGLGSLDGGSRSRSRCIISRRCGELIIRDVLNSHMVLLKALGNRLLASIGDASGGRIFGRHCRIRLGRVTDGRMLDEHEVYQD
jgi:hypothetical protein